jgi:hypothetical protein
VLSAIWCRGWDSDPTRLGDIANFSFSPQLPSLFSLFAALTHSLASLAGSEKYDKKMPKVRRVHFRRTFHRYKHTKSEMPKMWQPEKLERWKAQRSIRSFSALSVQKLRTTLFLTVLTPLSFFKTAARRRLSA